MIAYETEQLSFSLLAMCRDGMAEEKGELSEYDTQRILGRMNDYTPAIHEWVQRLAEHGALMELHEEAQAHN